MNREALIAALTECAEDLQLTRRYPNTDGDFRRMLKCYFAAREAIELLPPAVAEEAIHAGYMLAEYGPEAHQ